MKEYYLIVTSISIALKNKEYDYAIKECNAYLNIHPKDRKIIEAKTEALNSQAIKLFHQKKYDEALDKSCQAYDISPNDRKIIDTYGSILNKQGTDLMELDQFQEAQKKFDQAIIINSSNKILYTNKAFVLIKLNNFPEALKFANQALELDPNCLPALVAKRDAEIGQAIKNKDYDLIIKECNTFLNNHPNNEKVIKAKTETLNSQAIKLFHQKKYDEALDKSSQAYDISPNDRKIIDTFSCILNKQGSDLAELNKFEEAQEKLNQALIINPSNEVLYANKAIIFNKSKNFPEALKFANQSIELDANFLQAIKAKRDAEIGQAFINKDYDFIIKECNAFLNNHPNNEKAIKAKGSALNRQAMELLDQEKYDEALDKSRQAYDISPNNKTTIIINAYILNKQGTDLAELNKFEDAQEKLNLALTINPSNEVLYANKAIIFNKSKNFLEALKFAKQAIDIDPDYLQAIKAKKEAEMGLAIKLEESEQDLNTASSDNVIILNKAPSEGLEKTALCDKLYRDQLKNLDKKVGSDYYSDNLTKKIKFNEETFDEFVGPFQEDVNALGVNLE